MMIDAYLVDLSNGEYSAKMRAPQWEETKGSEEKIEL